MLERYTIFVAYVLYIVRQSLHFTEIYSSLEHIFQAKSQFAQIIML